MREELKTAQDAYNKATGSQTKIVGCWDEFFADRLDQIVVKAKEWLNSALDSLESEWKAKQGNNKLKSQVARIIKVHRDSVDKKVKLDTKNLV